MSKGAEKAALTFYPVLFSERNGLDNSMEDRRISFENGYDCATEKAVQWLKDNPYVITGDETYSHYIERFYNAINSE